MVEISKIERSKRKTLSVIITPMGEVVVKAPLNLPDREIQRFIQEKEGWILSKIKKLDAVNSEFNEVISYQKLLVLGTAYNGYKSKSVSKIELMPDKILIPDRINSEKLYKKVISWYKILADSVLIPRVKEISTLVNIPFKSVKCTGSRGRWGACNNKREIFLNWRCIMLPQNLIDYVIVHELAHIIELNHSPKFWNVVGQMLKDYKPRRQSLKNYSFALKLF